MHCRHRQLSLRLFTTQTFNIQKRLRRYDTTTTISTPIYLLCKIRSIKPEFKFIHLPLSFVQAFVTQSHQQLITVRGIDACIYRSSDTPKTHDKQTANKISPPMAKKKTSNNSNQTWLKTTMSEESHCRQDTQPL